MMTDKTSTITYKSPFRRSGVAAYLFGWNPYKFEWANLDNDIARLAAGEKVEDNWSVASHKSIKPGDRAYVVRVGVEPKGIFASGYVSSEPFLASRKGRIYHRINIEFDVLLNPDKEPILNLNILKTGALADQNWTPQASGISIRPQLVEELEGVWLDFLGEHPKFGVM
ncbi:hypothetical protein FPZ42_02645 [Mucilaginibacter achroorhodeus]|uniref:EVE domain-containing protein n=1 Tax=Mucilaginibacter achroorhodeus TaxID=2599294 RepID=A0A563UA25_9SPHI|nr:hypothetical protein [Mucilaginibacter achroorhodeus]TWR28133.1 hypothetical protein FPZ42_02645 [Mucilaginibacter achroorhodeus]